MNSVIATLGVFLVLAVVVMADPSTDGCVCVSANFGCEAIKNKKKMIQTGWCNKRCCTDPNPGEKRECKCMHAPFCPEEYPEESGDCSHLVSCCPDRSTRKQEL